MEYLIGLAIVAMVLVCCVINDKIKGIKAQEAKEIAEMKDEELDIKLNYIYNETGLTYAVQQFRNLYNRLNDETVLLIGTKRHKARLEQLAEIIRRYNNIYNENIIYSYSSYKNMTTDEYLAMGKRKAISMATAVNNLNSLMTHFN